MRTIQPISPRQLNVFRNLWEFNSAFANGNGNNREVQPLNGRQLVTGGHVLEIDPMLRLSIVFGLLFAFALVGLFIVVIRNRFFARAIAKLESGYELEV